MLLNINRHPLYRGGIKQDCTFHRITFSQGVQKDTELKTMTQHIVFVVLLALASTCCGHIGGHTSYQETGSQVYCGRNLARAMAAICFDYGSPEKRSDAGTMYGTLLAPYYKEQEGSYGWPWLAPHNARSLNLPSRGKRFVVNECCEKACTISELWSYC